MKFETCLISAECRRPEPGFYAATTTAALCSEGGGDNLEQQRGVQRVREPGRSEGLVAVARI